MKYFKLFQSVADANTQGEAGLASPHISIVEGKNVVNMVKMSENPFNATFSDDGSIVTYAGWDIEGTYDMNMDGYSYHILYGNSSGGVIDMNNDISTLGYDSYTYTLTDTGITIQFYNDGVVSDWVINADFWYENKKYKLFYGDNVWIISSIDYETIYLSIVIVPDIDRKEEYTTTLSMDDSTKEEIEEGLEYLLNKSGITINSIKYPSREEYSDTLQKYVNSAIENGVDIESGCFDEFIEEIYSSDLTAAEYLGKINYTYNGENYNMCLILAGL